MDQHPVDLVFLLKQVVASFESYASEKGVELVLKQSLAPVIMNIDSNKVVTIMNNLVSNAIKFTSANNSVNIELEETSQETDAIDINARDSGVGISAENLPHVFDRFYQVSHGEDKQYGGSGVGLTLS